MNVVGFEAFVLETVISRKLFSCFATTSPGPSILRLSLSKRATFLILTCCDPAAQIHSFCIAGLMFNGRDVRQFNVGPQI